MTSRFKTIRQLDTTRRSVLTRGAAGLAWGAGLLTGGIGLLPQAMAQNVSISPEKLMAKSALPDIWVGSEKAPVTIIEYASMTCSHCATFHAGTYKELKKEYIDTGKVRMTVREFPFDPLAMAAFMLARCEGPQKRNAMMDHLFATQATWTRSKKPLEALIQVTRQAGMSQESFEKCLKDRELYQNISKNRDYGTANFKITSTPTFFINGVRISGDQDLAVFAKIIDPMVAANK